MRIEPEEVKEAGGDWLDYRLAYTLDNLTDTHEAIARAVAERTDSRRHSSNYTSELLEVLERLTGLVIELSTHIRDTNGKGPEPSPLPRGALPAELEEVLRRAARLTGNYAQNTEAGGSDMADLLEEEPTPVANYILDPQDAARIVNIGAITIPNYGDRWARVKAAADFLADHWQIARGPNGDTLIELYRLTEEGRRLNLEQTRTILEEAALGLNEAGR